MSLHGKWISCAVMALASHSTVSIGAETSTGFAATDAAPKMVSVVAARALLDSWNGEPSVLADARAMLDQLIKLDPISASAYVEDARYYVISGRRSSSSLQMADRSIAEAIRADPKPGPISSVGTSCT